MSVDREERARVGVGFAAVVSCVLSLAGALLALAERYRPGYALMVAGVAVGAGCLWHNGRNAHERGRWFAVVAILVGIAVGCGVAWGHYRWKGWPL